MNGNLIFSLKPKPPIPFLNPGGDSREGISIYSRFLLGGKGCRQSFRALLALLSKQTCPARGAGKVAGAVQPVQASP